jgi:GNAT superfamily N-acetyltransferase
MSGWQPHRTKPVPPNRAGAEGVPSPQRDYDSAVLPSTETHELRFATEGDIPTLMAFVVELAEFERLSHEVVLTPEKMRADFLAGRFECLMVFPKSGGPVGFALFFHVYSTFEGLCLYLEDLYIVPASRGCGCGTLLLRALGCLAQRRDCARMMWQALDWNEKATAFYKSAEVGASERTGDDGTKWLSFIMRRPEIAGLAASAKR